MRVPTREDASCLFWEFASDNFDVGFGVQFEWIAEPPQKICLQVFDTDEDENEESNEDGQSEVQVVQGPAASASPAIGLPLIHLSTNNYLIYNVQIQKMWFITVSDWKKYKYKDKYLYMTLAMEPGLLFRARPSPWSHLSKQFINDD